MAAEPVNLDAQLEAQRTFTLLPPQVLDVVSGKMEAPATAPVVHADKDGKIQRIYNEQVIVPGLGPTDFSIDRRHYYEKWPSDFDMADFQYNKGDKFIGSMQFLHKPDGTYTLAHRYVVPEMRGKHVGEDLLARSEAAFQAIANKENRTVEINAQFGQRKVISWFLHHGYELADDHSRQDWEEVQQHPEHFVFETIADSQLEEKMGREDGIFRVATEGRQLVDTVRINLKKVLQPIT